MELVASEIIERIKSHLSPKELESIGFNTQAVSGWKLHNRIPKSEDLYKIAQAIGVSMEYLLTGNDEKENPADLSKLVQKLTIFTVEEREPMITMLEGQVDYWKKILKK